MSRRTRGTGVVTRRVSKRPNTRLAKGSTDVSDGWNRWIDIPLDVNDGWKVISGVGVDYDSRIAYTDGQMIVTLNKTGNKQVTGATKNGYWLIREQHLMPWDQAGLEVPAGANAYGLYPGSVMLVVEVRFDSDLPISANPVGASHGRWLQCTVNLNHYASDQGGDPASPGADEHCGTFVVKTGAGAPTDTDLQLFKSGFNHYNGRAYSGGYKWSCQSGAGSAGMDTIVFQAGIPVGGEDGSLRRSCGAVARASTDPFGFGLGGAGYTTETNSCKFAKNRYLHLGLSFGSYNAQTGVKGVFRIAKMRYMLQPLVGRASGTIRPLRGTGRYNNGNHPYQCKLKF